MELGFYRAIFFLRVAWPWIDVRYIPPDLGNVLEAYKKNFDVWKNFEVDLKLTSRPQYTQSLTTTLWTFRFYSRFSTFPWILVLTASFFFLRVAWPWIDIQYISSYLSNILEAYHKMFRRLKKFWDRLWVEKSKICSKIKIFKESLWVVRCTEVDQSTSSWPQNFSDVGIFFYKLQRHCPGLGKCSAHRFMVIVHVEKKKMAR